MKEYTYNGRRIVKSEVGRFIVHGPAWGDGNGEKFSPTLEEEPEDEVTG